MMTQLRLAARVLRHSPSFAITAIVTLGLAIGANSAVFSLADALLFRPLPYPQPDRLGAITTFSRSPRGEGTQESQDGATWELVRDHATSVDVAMWASSFGRGVNLVTGATASRVNQARVSAGFFRVLGIQPFAGHEFTPEQDRPGGPPVAILAYSLWQRLFNGDTRAIGRTILLRGEPYEIVGVMPPDFQSPIEGTDVWTPARPSTTGEGGGTNYTVIARVRDGDTWLDASSELGAISRTFFAERGLPAGASRWLTLTPFKEFLRADTRDPITLLAASVGMVLIIACVNLAALLLARGSTRAREMATRMALGSGRFGIVRQLLFESLVIGLAGGAFGLVLAFFGLEGLKALGQQSFIEWQHATLDGRTVAVTAALALLTSLVFGIAPAMQASRLAITSDLAGGGSRTVAGSSRHATRRVLVVAEVALGVVLLVVTGLLIRTFVNLRSANPGFDPTHTTTAAVSLQDARYKTPDQITRLFDESLAQLQRTPGIESAAVSLELPYSRLLNSGFRFGDEPTDDNHQYMANFMYVTPDFFETLRIPIRDGRSFAPTDRAGAPLVAIVNETLVRSWAKGTVPIGRSIGRGPTARTIIGVVGDVQVTNSGFSFPGRESGPIMTSPTVFIPAAQASEGFFRMVHTWFSPFWSVRTRDSVDAGSAIARAIAAVDPLLPLGSVRRIGEVQSEAMAPQRLLMTLVGVLAAVAVLLAAIGIHGVIAQHVAERTREFGIRLALGASAAQTMRAVTGGGLLLALIGATAGIGLSFLAVQTLQAMNATIFWNVGGRDPLTYVAVGAFLFVIAAIASFVPSLRILRVDPARTLRE